LKAGGVSKRWVAYSAFEKHRGGKYVLRRSGGRTGTALKRMKVVRYDFAIVT